jgi:hypothetical protein
MHHEVVTYVPLCKKGLTVDSWSMWLFQRQTDLSHCSANSNDKQHYYPVMLCSKMMNSLWQNQEINKNSEKNTVFPTFTQQLHS